MTFRPNDGDKEKFNHSLHHYTPKKFDHSLHYITPSKVPIHPDQEYYYDKRLECSSIEFNGTSSYIRIPDSASLSPTSTMTAMIWVKGNKINQRWLLSHYDTGISQRSFGILTTDISPYDKPKFYISDNGTWTAGHRKQYTSSITTFYNNWSLIGFSFNVGTLKIFVNAIEDTNPTKTLDEAITTVHNSTVDIILGCYLNNNTPTGLFKGSIAKPLIYNRVLTDAEWMNVYTGVPISREGLVLDMPMTNNCTGDTIKDLSGYGNHGTLTDCVWNQKWVTERKKVL